MRMIDKKWCQYGPKARLDFIIIIEPDGNENAVTGKYEERIQKAEEIKALFKDVKKLLLTRNGEGKWVVECHSSNWMEFAAVRKSYLKIPYEISYMEITPVAVS